MATSKFIELEKVHAVVGFNTTIYVNRDRVVYLEPGRTPKYTFIWLDSSDDNSCFVEVLGTPQEIRAKLEAPPCDD